MAVYKFKIWFEDHEDIYREIEIRAVQTFFDLNNSIQEAFGFDNKHPASFFISDDYWRKGEEVAVLNPNSGEEDKKSKKHLSKSKLAAFIEDPHQKFIYLFDPTVPWVFCIELIKILTEDTKASYPRCVKTIGIAKKQYKTKTTAPPVEPDDEEASPFPVAKKEFIPGNSEEEVEAFPLNDDENIEDLLKENGVETDTLEVIDDDPENILEESDEEGEEDELNGSEFKDENQDEY